MVIPDEVLAAAGITERELLVEIACHLYDSERLTMPAAAKLAQLTRAAFEAELVRRKIPLFRPTVEDLEADLAAFDRLES